MLCSWKNLIEFNYFCVSFSLYIIRVKRKRASETKTEQINWLVNAVSFIRFYSYVKVILKSTDLKLCFDAFDKYHFIFVLVHCAFVVLFNQIEMGLSRNYKRRKNLYLMRKICLHKFRFSFCLMFVYLTNAFFFQLREKGINRWTGPVYFFLYRTELKSDRTGPVRIDFFFK